MNGYGQHKVLKDLDRGRSRVRRKTAMDKSANTVLGERKVQKRCRRTSRRHEAIETKNKAARDASEARGPRWNLLNVSVVFQS